MATIVRLNVKKWADGLFGKIEKEQTNRLLKYAEKEMRAIGNSFIAWEETGNLADSLCYAVYHNGKLAGSGYYRPEMATLPSKLHELSPAITKEVYGHALAQEFIATYQPTQKKGWQVVWGALAPYWAYWEAGHYNVLLKQGARFEVMTQHKDKIDGELSPKCKTTIQINVPTY